MKPTEHFISIAPDLSFVLPESLTTIYLRKDCSDEDPDEQNFILTITNKSVHNLELEELEEGRKIISSKASSTTQINIEAADYSPSYTFQENLTFSSFTITRISRPLIKEEERMSVIDAFAYACERQQIAIVQKRIGKWAERGGKAFIAERINRRDNNEEVRARELNLGQCSGIAWSRGAFCVNGVHASGVLQTTGANDAPRSQRPLFTQVWCVADTRVWRRSRWRHAQD